MKDILGDKCETDSATVKLLCEVYGASLIIITTIIIIIINPSSFQFQLKVIFCHLEAQLREKESLVSLVRETVREKESLVRETVREKELLLALKEREKELLLALKDKDIEMQKKLLHDIQSRDYLSGGRSLLGKYYYCNIFCPCRYSNKLHSM